MASTMELSLPLSILFFLNLASSASASASQRRLLQSNSPQNIQTSFPSNPTPAFANYAPPPNSAQASSPGKSHDDKRLTKAVVITALSSFAASSVVYGIVHWFAVRNYRKESNRTGEDGKLGSGRMRCSRCYNVLNVSTNESNMEGRKIQNRPLLPSGSMNSSSQIADDSNMVVAATAPPPPLPPKAPTPPPPLPPPPPPPAIKKNLAPAAPIPPMPPRPNAPRSGTSTPPPGGGPSRAVPGVPGDGEGERAHAKLRPLHWDKVTALNPEHSMVWDKMNTDNSSFRFNDDLMESLFGYTATNRQPQNSNRNSANTSSSPSVPSQVCLLDPRKSQNFAIVIRSLAIGRQEILDALHEGRGLGHDTLEKLSKIAPTREEEKKIFEFNADPSTLADAESFLHSLLKVVPSPFLRLEAMLFRSSYDTEILHLKQSLQTLELACHELKSRGLFIKLLEVILKAGNRMNAGTARGNAKAFNLSALCKLSDVKSTDGRTTLLHFVVEEVVRLEGRRLAINRSASITRSGSIGSNDSLIKASRDRKEKEYMMLGLPVVGGLSSELANVKKAAAVDFDSLINSCLYIGERIRDIRQFLNGCANDRFVKETKGFLEAASDEVRVVAEEQVRIMELVRRTTEYYQPGYSKEKAGQPLQLFVIVKDFLVMFDRVCTDITRNTQKKTVAVATQSKANATKETGETTKRVVATFPNLPPRFMAESFKYSSGSDSEDEF